MKLMITLTTVALALPISQALPASRASAQAPISKTVFIDNQPIQTTIIMQNGLQLVPASFFRQLNVSVEWKKSSRTAVLNDGNVEIGFPVGQRYSKTRSLNENTKQQNESLHTRTTLINGSAYIPLAYTARELGLDVQYDASKRAAMISTGTEWVKPLAVQNQAVTTLDSNVTAEELYWLYQITEAEAGGESYDGKVAVAASILNRVADPVWPNSIIDTIFQVETYNGKAYYQYSPVLDKRIYAVVPSEDTKRAVQDALSGSDPGKGAVVFYNPDKTDNAWVHSRPVTVKIGNHVFAK